MVGVPPARYKVPALRFKKEWFAVRKWIILSWHDTWRGRSSSTLAMFLEMSLGLSSKSWGSGISHLCVGVYCPGLLAPASILLEMIIHGWKLFIIRNPTYHAFEWPSSSICSEFHLRGWRGVKSDVVAWRQQYEKAKKSGHKKCIHSNNGHQVKRSMVQFTNSCKAFTGFQVHCTLRIFFVQIQIYMLMKCWIISIFNHSFTSPLDSDTSDHFTGTFSKSEFPHYATTILSIFDRKWYVVSHTRSVCHGRRFSFFSAPYFLNVFWHMSSITEPVTFPFDGPKQSMILTHLSCWDPVRTILVIWLENWNP